MPDRQFYQIHSINCYYIRRYICKYQRRVFANFQQVMAPGRQLMLQSTQAVGFSTGYEYGYALGVF